MNGMISRNCHLLKDTCIFFSGGDKGLVKLEGAELQL